jgi:hypothetical protein
MMTDANLMDAHCIHGVPWYECEQCIDERETADAQATDDDWFDES